MAVPRPTQPRPRLLNTFAGFALGVLIVTVLYFAQTIFIPVALAVFFAFLMAPVVNWLDRWIGRIGATIATVLAATGLLVGVGWMVTHQLAGLAQSLGQPQYAQNISLKMKNVEGWLQGGIVTEIRQLTHKVEERVHGAPKDGGENDRPLGEKPQAEQPKDTPDTPAAAPEVVTVGPVPPWLSGVPGSLGRVGEALAQAALVAILVVFMLVRREDLRNRVIRLIGHGRLTVTTMAIDDAGGRISRYLIAQLVINTCYGLIFAAGLRLVGVPYAFLWGFLAAVMRYVPYVGIWLAVVPPVFLSLAASPGWTMPLWVVGMVVVLELVSANVIEPVLFGHSIGVSEVALLVAAAFWAWLWGPIGLILSTPLTVCLVVLGKYVPQLEFFDVLLGDSPALPARLMFYQRLLARDQDEAAAVVETFARSAPPETAYDEFLVPALVWARRDLDHLDLSEPDEQYIVSAVAETAEQIAAGDLSPTPPATEPGDIGAPPDGARAMVLGCPARDETDEVALRMLRSLLDPARWDLDIVPAGALAAELIERVDQVRPAAVCIVALPPGGLAHTRYLCKRLRQRFPDLKLVVGLWGLEGDAGRARELLAEAGADHVATLILQTRAQLGDWLPVFATPADNGQQTEVLAGR